MRRFAATTTAIVSAALAALVFAEPAYRLAGIITPESGSALALIELPSAEQQLVQYLVRAGDSVGEARVTSITDRSVRLQLPGGDVILELARFEGELPGTSPVSASSGPLMIDADGRARIEDLAAKADGLKDESLARQLVAELRLRADQQIATINQSPVEDTASAVKAIARELSMQSPTGSALKLVISFAEPAEERFRVYYIAGRVDGSLESE